MLGKCLVRHLGFSGCSCRLGRDIDCHLLWLLAISLLLLLHQHAHHLLLIHTGSLGGHSVFKTLHRGAFCACEVTYGALAALVANTAWLSLQAQLNGRTLHERMQSTWKPLSMAMF